MTHRWHIPLAVVTLLVGGLTATAETANASAPVHTATTSAATSTHPAGLPAGFEPGGPPHPTHSALPRTAGIANDATTRNWSGYAVSGAAGSYTSISGEWQQAALSCTDPNTVQYVSFWAGLDGFNSNSVEQTGTLGICDGTTALYYAWYEMYPNPPVYFNEPVQPGVLFVGAVTYNGNDSYTLRLQAVSATTWSQSVTVTQPGLSRSSAEMITEAPTVNAVIAPLADFQFASYRTTFVNGTYLGSQNPTKIVMINAAGQPLDTTVGITPIGGFHNNWLMSS